MKINENQEKFTTQIQKTVTAAPISTFSSSEFTLKYDCS